MQLVAYGPRLGGANELGTASIVIYECPNFTYRRVFRILFATAATTTRATIIIQYSMWMTKTSNPWMSICKIASSGRQPENILFLYF